MSVTAVNSSGVVVGELYLGNDQYRAFMWDGTLHTLWSGAGATDISDSGFIVGRTGTRAVTWRAGVLTDIAPGWAGGVNELGHVVGQTYNDYRPFLYRDGQLHPLGTATGYARAVNDQDDAVGAATFAVIKEHATLWANGGSAAPMDLGWLGPNVYGNSYAKAINNNRLVVGLSEFPTAWDRESHAFYWDGQLHDLGKGSALDVNDAGTIVGTLDPRVPFAFAYGTGQLTSLPDLGFGGTAVAISSNGIIAGEVYSGDDHSSPRLAVWTPVPEPASLLALAGLLSGAGLLRVRWRESSQ